MNTTIVNIIAVVLSKVFSALSPTIRGAISDFINNLHTKALDTENPIDDLFTGILKDILDV